MKTLSKIFLLPPLLLGISGTAFASATRDASVGLLGHYKLVSPVVTTYGCNPAGSRPGQQNGMYWVPQINSSTSGSDFTFSIFGPYGGDWNHDYDSQCNKVDKHDESNGYYFTLAITFQIKKDNNPVQTCTIHTGMKWGGVSGYFYDHHNLPDSRFCDGGAGISQCNGRTWIIGDNPPSTCGSVHPT